MQMELKDAVSNLENALKVAKFADISIPQSLILVKSLEVIKEHCLPGQSETKEGTV